MPFKVLARTLLEMGAELISSDGIALYELVKNGFDARSDRVDIHVRVTLPYSAYMDHRNEIQRLAASDDNPDNVAALRDDIVKSLKNIPTEDSDRKTFIELLKRPRTKADLIERLDEAYAGTSYILVKDSGEGMSERDLVDNFLTIGTRNRYKEKRSDRSKKVLGEKGVGRLSAMRLGNRLEVRTSRAGETHWNLLDIDWTLFSHESDAMIESVNVSPTVGERKGSANSHGTELRIESLLGDWSEARLNEIAREQFARLNDPFSSEKRFPIGLWFNADRVQIPFFPNTYLAHAHAVLKAWFEVHPVEGPRLRYEVDYKYRDRQVKDTVVDLELLSTIDPSPISALVRLGPFEVEAYWYNRLKLRETVDDPLELRETRNFVQQWGGGLMLFRDGFRVNPYGSQDDDWLQLDPEAFKAKGYKVNRSQIVGRVAISSSDNPYLVDQTNREGLRSGLEKDVFIRVLRTLLAVQFRLYIDNVDKEEKTHELADLRALEEALGERERALLKSARKLAAQHPEAQPLVLQMEDFVQEIHQLTAAAEAMKEAAESELDKTVHLAGLGLMVEMISHELTRATQQALQTVTDARSRNLPADLVPTFKNLEGQMKTLEKRLRTLDPLSVSGRQTKVDFDLLELLKEIIESHQAQFSRHGIKPHLRVTGGNARSVPIHAVKGMFIQIFENLVANSVYWLKQERKKAESFEPRIDIVIDAAKEEVLFEDNGPGIPPARKELIFEAFYTSKPPGKGKGLGLYIARQLARYHGVEVKLSDRPTAHQERLNTFVVSYRKLRR